MSEFDLRRKVYLVVVCSIFAWLLIFLALNMWTMLRTSPRTRLPYHDELWFWPVVLGMNSAGIVGCMLGIKKYSRKPKVYKVKAIPLYLTRAPVRDEIIYEVEAQRIPTMKPRHSSADLAPSEPDP